MQGTIDMEIESIQEGLMTDAGLTRDARTIMRAQAEVLESVKDQYDQINN